jgi:integrase/recombinase XerD
LKDRHQPITKPKKKRRCPANYIQRLEINQYATNTAKTYISCFEAFINHFKDRELLAIDEQDIRGYLQHLARQGRSQSSLNQAVNAIKFYYEIVMEMPNRFYSIDRPRATKPLPKVISKEEVHALINATGNSKHRCIASILYAAGLRRDEVLRLTLADIDSKRMVIYVRNGKGNKDRHSILSPTLLADLRTYYTQWRPKEYLFEGPNGGPYSGSSILT